MAQYSVYHGKTIDAQDLKLVNAEIIINYLTNKAPSTVIISKVDWIFLGSSSAEVKQILNQNYELIFQTEKFGQWASPLNIYRVKE